MQIYLNKCLKCSPLAITQQEDALDRLWRGCIDDTLINSFSDCNKMFMQFVDMLLMGCHNLVTNF